MLQSRVGGQSRLAQDQDASLHRQLGHWQVSSGQPAHKCFRTISNQLSDFWLQDLVGKSVYRCEELKIEYYNESNINIKLGHELPGPDSIRYYKLGADRQITI